MSMRTRTSLFGPGVLFSLLALQPACSSHQLPNSEPQEQIMDGLLSANQVRPESLRRKAGSPPPLGGGTVMVSGDDRVAVVSEPASDRIYVVNLEAQSVVKIIQLADMGIRAEPGRCVEDGLQHASCLLRGTNEVLRVRLADGAARDRQRVCSEPRGLAAQQQDGQPVLRVVCATGELVTLRAGDLTPLSVRQLRDPESGAVLSDLRDVIVADGRLLVTRFRSAEVLTIDAQNSVTQVIPAPSADPQSSASHLAWRLIPGGPKGQMLLYENHYLKPLALTAWAPPCTGPMICPIAPVLTVGGFLSSGLRFTAKTVLPDAPLPIDGSFSRDGTLFTWMAAGNVPMPIDSKLGKPLPAPGSPLSVATVSADGALVAIKPLAVPAGFKPEALAPFKARGFLIHDRGNRSLHIYADGATILRSIRLDAQALPIDNGMETFHAAGPFKVACASCHAEAGDDGHVWQRNLSGQALPRRTLSLRGGLLSSAPFQWDGGHADMSKLIPQDLDGMGLRRDSVSGLPLAEVGRWLDEQPAAWRPTTWQFQQSLVARGQELFEQRCVSCHNGPQLTMATNQSAGGKLPAVQVPRLMGVSDRAPFLHDGCAGQLAQVFDGTCASAGPVHDLRTGLTSDDQQALLTYLGTL